ncbi:MAG: histidinol phosphatase [Methanoregula sp.]|jgi:predicted metal-dependent phosphoesterase TrpH|uniref:PHP-associated domain-containing protein n=1 Tax=Methanoregula sp. TaxID=2052170 RepID=UPI0025D5AD42|nr:PHP-associated domain-containing protein [Methanoregula sp.]MCK9630868.1 histidinol phosphatase [Methanoregula sp.]
MTLPSPHPPDVRFARPYPERILADGYHPADMHFHTVHSDGTVSIRTLLRWIRKHGAGCAVTDHNEVSGALAACRERDGLLVIPGIEISTSDGPHILVYFSSPGDLEDFFVRHIRDRRRESPWMLTTLTSQEVLDAAEGYACLRGAAHPYGYLLFNSGLGKCIEKGYLDESLYRQCDLIEGICANMARRENKKAISLATRLGLPVTGGTDGHVIFDLGSAVTCTRSADPADFLDELKHGRATVIGRENHLGSKMLTAAAITARFMPWLLPSTKIHCERFVGRVDRLLNQRGKMKEK